MTLLWLLSGVTFGAFLLAILAVPRARRWALHVGLVDDPAAGVYKTHRRPVPYGGGLAIGLAVAAPTAGLLAWMVGTQADVLCPPGGWTTPWAPDLLFPLEPWSPTVLQVAQVTVVLAAAAVLLALGLVDDRRCLPAGLRLGLQLALAGGLVVAVPGFRLEEAGLSPWVGGATAALWIVALTNAFNFLDNMNGLAAGLAALTLSVTAAIGLTWGHLPVAVVGLAATGASAGFLGYNFPVASIFMGDAGGLFLGFLAGALSILLVGSGPAPGAANWLPLAAFAVPVYDLVSVVGLRLRAGHAPWRGDTRHVSHRLVAAGLSRTHAVLVLYALTAVTSLSCVIAAGGSSWYLAGTAAPLVAFAAVDLAVARRRDR